MKVENVDIQAAQIAKSPAEIFEIPQMTAIPARKGANLYSVVILPALLPVR